MDSGDEEEEVTMVSIGDMRVPLHEVTDDMVANMTAEEKENYIRLGQELYSHLYEWEDRMNFWGKKEIMQEKTLFEEGEKEERMCVVVCVKERKRER